jgi:hypothetical protein
MFVYTVYIKYTKTKTLSHNIFFWSDKKFKNTYSLNFNKMKTIPNNKKAIITRVSFIMIGLCILGYKDLLTEMHRRNLLIVFQKNHWTDARFVERTRLPSEAPYIPLRISLSMFSNFIFKFKWDIYVVFLCSLKEYVWNKKTATYFPMHVRIILISNCSDSVTKDNFMNRLNKRSLELSTRDQPFFRCLYSHHLYALIFLTFQFK